MNLRSKKGIEFALEWIIYPIILIVLLTGSVEAVQEFGAGDAFAESSAKTFGRTIDVASVSPYNISISLTCPSDYVFTMENGLIIAESKSLISEHRGEYAYLYDSGTTLSIQNRIDCSSYSDISVKKTFDPDTSEAVLEVYGVE